jgi:L,D-transpeptidase ErfK/SrfK
MRLSMDAIDTLCRNVAIGTEVHIIHHASKAGWLGNNLYLEVHSPLNDLSEEPNALNKAEVEDAIEGALQFRSAHINWDEVYKDEKKHDGMPHIIGTRA